MRFFFQSATCVAAIAAVAALGVRPSAAQSATPSAAQSTQPFVVIVSNASPVRSLTRDQLSKLFLKKETRLPGGRDAVPVELDSRSAMRAEFVGAVHQRSVAAVNSYWQQQIFAGRDVPPRALPSEGEVIAYVRGNPDAIGYVSAGTGLGQGVRVVRIER